MNHKSQPIKSNPEHHTGDYSVNLVKDNEVPSNILKNKFGLEHHHADDIKFCKGVIQKQDQTLKMDST